MEIIPKLFSIFQELEGSLVVYLDVEKDDILTRLKKMKVSRIVDHTSTYNNLTTKTPKSKLSDILQKRLVYYEKYFDIRVWPEKGVSLETLKTQAYGMVLRMADKEKEKQYTSTRGNIDVVETIPSWNLKKVILSGMVPNEYGGGLYIPKANLPYLNTGMIKRLVSLSSYQERAKIILEMLIPHHQISAQALALMISEAYSTFQTDPNVIVPLHNLDENIYLEELFHGPTGSFKDLALQLLPRLIGAVMKCDQRSLYVVATSGDTGSAVLEGFGRLQQYKSQLALLVMYPENGISPIQKQQMVSYDGGKNVSVVGIKGNFDDCQKIVKELFANKCFLEEIKTKYNVTLNTANSINYGRILPQIVYHINSYCNLVCQKVINVGEMVDICIPTGNFGNILSAICAKEMGVSFDNIICASNDNKILSDFFETGVYDLRARNLKKTISPAIDILVSSNLERYLYMCLGPQRTSELYRNLSNDKYFRITEKELSMIKNKSNIHHGWCNEEECKAIIADMKERKDYMLDPHTGVGVKVAKDFRKAKSINDKKKMIVASTAHYAKFEFATDEGQLPQYPRKHIGIHECKNKAVVHSARLEATLNVIIDYLNEFLSSSFK